MDSVLLKEPQWKEEKPVAGQTAQHKQNRQKQRDRQTDRHKVHCEMLNPTAEDPNPLLNNLRIDVGALQRGRAKNKNVKN